MTKNLSLLILIFLPLGVFAQVAKDSTKAAIKKSIQKEFSKTRIFNLEFDQSFSRSYDSELFKEDFTEGKIRSEERRVGKEGRTQWEKKQKTAYEMAT